MTSKKLPLLVWVAFIILSIVWGTTYLGVKIAVQYFPPFWFSGFRNISAGLLLIAFSKMQGYSFPSFRDIGKLAIIGFFMITGGNALLAWAMKYISSGLGSILSATAPLFVTFLSIFFFKGFRVTWAIFSGLILSIIGIALLSKPDNGFQITEDFELGIFLAFVANLAWAFGSIFMKKFTVETNILMRTGIQMAIPGTFNLLVGTLIEPKINFSSVTTEGWLWVAYLVLIGSIIAYMCFVYLLEYMAPARLSIHVYINTIVAVLVGWLFADETLTWTMLGAMVVVLIGVLMVNNAYSKMAQFAFK